MGQGLIGRVRFFSPFPPRPLGVLSDFQPTRRVLARIPNKRPTGHLCVSLADRQVGNKLGLETIGAQIWCARKYAELWRLGSGNFPLDIIMDSWYTDLKMN